MSVKKRQNILPVLFAVAVCFAAVLLSANTMEAAVRETDVSTPSEGNVLVQVPGEYEKAEIATILKQVNGYRLEACRNGYPDPDDPSEKLTMADYSEVKWSGDLEWIAQTRAAEGAVFQGHKRPNGESCFTVSHNDIYSSSETLAWNYGSLTGGISQWYEEKRDWIAQNSAAVTGHYTAMIDPDLKYIGIGCFTSKSGDLSCIAGAYSREDTLSEAPQGGYGPCVQTMEVPASSLSGLMLQGKKSIALGKSATYTVVQNVAMPGIMGWTIETPIQLGGTPIWSVSNRAVASITSTGTLTGVSVGSVNVTVTYPNGLSASLTVKIEKPAKGTVFTVGTADYKVTKASGEAAFVRSRTAAGTLTIPDTVTYAGVNYKVTSIAANACKNKKYTGVKIGKNVSGIGKKAFYNCKKLKTLTIQTQKLTSKKVGSKAFSKTPAKLKVKVPKKVKKAYKKWLYKKGVNKKAKIK